MNRLLLCLLAFGTIASVAFAGETYSGKEMKQVAPPPCPQWYADREFNVSLWGTYVFTGNNWVDDRYIEADHAWGGGVDFKYFFMRYVGVGIEGWAVDANQKREDIFVDFSDGIFQRARALRLIFLAAPAGSLVAVRGQSIRHLLNREKASTLCRLSVILTPRRGRSVRLAAEWKFGSPRTLAGSVTSAGTLWTDPITTSAWSAQV